MTLTREEILATEPGVELDALVAHAMGWSAKERWGAIYWVDEDGCSRYEAELFKPSQYLNIAFEVLANEKSHQLTYSEAGFSHSDLKYRAIVGRNQDVAYAKTAPEAICKARMLAVLNL